MPVLAVALIATTMLVPKAPTLEATVVGRTAVVIAAGVGEPAQSAIIARVRVPAPGGEPTVDGAANLGSATSS